MEQDSWSAAARARGGVVLPGDLGAHPGRSARRKGLVPVAGRAFVAGSQPVDVGTALQAVLGTTRGGSWALLSEGALWSYGVAELPDVAQIGIVQTCRLVVTSPLAVRRVAPSVLQGWRTVSGLPVVALEVALIQVAPRLPAGALRELITQLLRERRTTVVRLRARCRRGFAGSARVRAVCDELAGASLDAQVRRLKAALEARGVTGLRVEVRFTNAAGASAYADLLHVGTMTVIEVDGFLSHLDRAAFRADRRRDRWMLSEHGARTLRVDVLEVVEDLEGLADELAPLLVSLPQAA